MLQSLFGPVASVATKFMEGRQKKAELKARIEEAKANAKRLKVRARRRLGRKSYGRFGRLVERRGLDDLFYRDHSWILHSCGTAVYAAGFDFLRTAPEWIQWGILASIGAALVSSLSVN